MIQFDKNAMDEHRFALISRTARERKRLRDKMQEMKKTIKECEEEYARATLDAHRLVFSPQEYFALKDKQNEDILCVMLNNKQRFEGFDVLKS